MQSNCTSSKRETGREEIERKQGVSYNEAAAEAIEEEAKEEEKKKKKVEKSDEIRMMA